MRTLSFATPQVTSSRRRRVRRDQDQNCRQILNAPRAARLARSEPNLKHDVREPIDLIERRGGRVEIQFGDSRVPERLYGPADRALGPKGAFGDHFGVVAQESVVVAQVSAGILFGVSTEGEVREGSKSRLLDPAGVPPHASDPL